jgi:predicted AlkP superfamily phosphohydrolase/phosphomutase
VFVNLRGRQPGGIVAAGAEYEAVRDEVIAVLSALTGPDGQKVARKVYRREEVFTGPCSERLPDVIMAQRDYLYATTLVSEGGGDKVFYPLPDEGAKGLHRHGDHRPDGILLARGPHIRQAELADPQIADVPATVLALLGVPIPEDFDGRVLTEMLTEDIELSAPSPAVLADEGPGREVLTEEEARAVRDRLKGLGYL